MRTIKKILQDYGWTQGAGGDFYFLNGYPHLHLKVDRDYHQVNSLREVLPHVKHLTLSFGGDGANVTFVRDGALQNRAALESALYERVGSDRAVQMQRMINLMTGMGVDL
ncbi:hypothetical protein BKI52_11560 [marine bacterium AO1-C]|nr:hypothetical protein BKI52_11560 [marine bacterium AO1-C]